MQRFYELLNLVNGRPLPDENSGEANRMRIVIRASLATVFFAGVWGIAAGSTDPAIAVANLFKLPMVLLLSALCALPAGLLAWKITGARHRATDLVVAMAACNFTASLVLAVLAPIVALYYHTSGYLGGILAMAACYIALIVGVAVLFLSVKRRLTGTVRFRSVLMPVMVLVGVHLASLVQFIHLASPILPELTVFDGGMDTVLGG